MTATPTNPSNGFPNRLGAPPPAAPPPPFGNLQAQKGVVHIVTDRCKGCGFCVEYCPRDVLEMSEAFNVKGYHPPQVVKADECLNCQLCETICPEFALFVTSADTVGLNAGMVKSNKEERGEKS